MLIRSQPAKYSNVQKGQFSIANYSGFSRLAPSFTHQYLIQKSSFGKTCNAKKKDTLQFQSLKLQVQSLSPPSVLLSSRISILAATSSERQTTVFHFCEEFWPAFEQVVFSDPAGDTELRGAIKTAMALGQECLKVPARIVPTERHTEEKTKNTEPSSSYSGSSYGQQFWMSKTEDSKTGKNAKMKQGCTVLRFTGAERMVLKSFPH